MTCIASTPYSRDLGDELRRLRETGTRYNGRCFATALNWDQSKVSNIENGKVHASEIDLVQFLTACGKDRDFINAFLERYRDAFNLYFVQVPQNLRTMVMAETSASAITSYDNVAIPGLLQLEEYTRELFRLGGLASDEEIEAGIRNRMDRQAILRRFDRPTATFFIHENVLQMKVGGDELMARQIRRMLHNTHTVRLIPASVAIPFSASYVLWEYERTAPVAFTSNDIAKVFAQDPAAVATVKSIFQRLDAVALDAGQSRRELSKLVIISREERDAPGLVAEEQL
ncbi:helix-turn-helix domain-containing protein [Lentzea tibetensis]|uniref:Helix-turn-helix domain-containing protein n=1 Tax=Lentzea tibetensis TaxID=2591470 RepID=A0A563EKT1_9PSEU|nr:helix-turn-helix transcriptional regulator [Lentzea tibetensis]TWP47770.1 helix-turn-helix domain-containing protein [Lentzea tibetensis]